MYSQRARSGSRTIYKSASRRRSDIGKQNIDPSRFVKQVAVLDQAEFIPVHKFADFKIDQLIKNNIAGKGYITPSPIQDQAIPAGLLGKDIVGIANTGTGKTAAFAVPILDKIIKLRTSKALILAPTRELALQIEGEFKAFAKSSGLFGTVLIGGTPMYSQVRDLRQNPSIVIGTPGRIKDHIERGNVNLSDFNIVVLDEVDRMVDMGFIADIRFILGRLSKVHQSYFFSATLDPKLRSLVETFLVDPVTISVKTAESSDNVHQNVLRVNSPSDKIHKLKEQLLQDAAQKTLIFESTQRGVERLSRDLVTFGFKADAIHGGKSQGQRQRALARFKQNEINILVATDVAARGIDVVDITHVINYSVPKTYDDYIHRIGRTGRAGRIGQALTFVGH